MKKKSCSGSLKLLYQKTENDKSVSLPTPIGWYKQRIHKTSKYALSEVEAIFPKIQQCLTLKVPVHPTDLKPPYL